ncbi:MAG TPA: TatD family deoxyribonuclease [Euryarchaeota archaeon]|nr:Tat-linked quality control protein TatD [archaeon BMS3Bbin15]HDL15617.1 TatD family deoxyribonuclease [Euryarchaeota archaeon]
MLDAHCHISFKKFNRDREEVIARAAGLGISMVDSAVSVYTALRSLELSSIYDNIHTSIGVHPYRAPSMPRDIIEEIKKIASGGDIVAVGEIGLDYHLKHKGEKQESVFREFLSLAVELSLPAVIHCREAEKEAFEILLELEVEKALFHCYSGSISLAERILEEGYSISLATNLCYSGHQRKLAESLPIKSIILETDSPYLSPVKQIKRNEPAFIEESVKVIEEIKGEDNRKIKEITERNTGKFYAI